MIYFLIKNLALICGLYEIQKKSEKFQTNLFDGKIIVEKNKSTNNAIVITGSFAKANFKSINKNDLKIFLENDLSKLSNLFTSMFSNISIIIFYITIIDHSCVRCICGRNKSWLGL